MSKNDDTTNQTATIPDTDTESTAKTSDSVSNTTHEKAEQQKSEELAVYEKLRQQVSATLKNVVDTINGESISKAVDKAGSEIKEFGEHSVETISKVMETMKKDLASTAQTMKPKLTEAADQAEKTFKTVKEKGGAFWQEVSTEGGHALEVSRDVGGAFFARFAKGLAEMSQKIGGKVDELLIYKEGETTHGGTFKCVSCGSTIKLSNPGHIPKCSECDATEFRRA